MQAETWDLRVAALGRYGETLTLEPASPSTREIPVHRLADPLVLRELLGPFAAGLGGSDPAVVASTWSKHYLAVVLPGALAAMTLHRAFLDAGPGSASLHLDGSTPQALRLHAPPCPWEGPGAELRALALRRLLAEQVAPVLEALHRETRVAREVLWGNAGNYCAWLYDRFAEEAPGNPAVAEDRAALLEATESPFAEGPNPLRDPVRYEHVSVGGLPRRVQVRRTCCLKYRLPGANTCYTCPRLTREARGHLLRALEARE